METGSDTRRMEIQKCCECGRSVRQGSSRFVNRVLELNDEDTRREMGRPFPDGDYVCADCELNN